MINIKIALVIQIITFILLVILASEQYQYQQRNRTIIRADVIVISLPITPTFATPTPTIPNAQEAPNTSTKTNAKITILATQSVETSNNNNSNVLAIEILGTIATLLSTIAIILGICIRRIRKRKQAYKRHAQVPIGNQAPFTTPINNFDGIDVQALAQYLQQQQPNQAQAPPRYK